MLIMLDIKSRWPALAGRCFCRRRMMFGHLFSWPFHHVLSEEILLQHIGQASNSDPKEPHPSCGIDSSE